MEFLQTAMSVGKALRTIVVLVVKNKAERVDDPARKERFLKAAEMIQENTKKILSALASLRESELAVAFLNIELGLEELKMCGERWQKNITLENLAPKLDGIEEGKYFDAAQHHFGEAEQNAFHVLCDRKNSTPLLRVEALGVALFCQAIMHLNERGGWLRLWRIILKRFFDDQTLAEVAVGEQSLVSNVFAPGNKTAKNRMISLTESLSNAIIAMLVSDPSLASAAQQFIAFFNERVSAVRNVANEQKQLFGRDEVVVDPKGIYWVKHGSWGRVVCAVSPSGNEFAILTIKHNLVDMILVGSNGLYLLAIEKFADDLVLIDLNSSSLKCYPIPSLYQIKFRRIYGYAEEEGMAYACCKEGEIWTIDLNTKDANLSQIDRVERAAIGVTNLLVAANGSLLAYDDEKPCNRYVRFASRKSEWFKIEASLVSITEFDHLIVVGPDEENRLTRLSFVSGNGVYQIQAETIKLIGNHVSCTIANFVIDAPLQQGAVRVDAARFPVTGSQSFGIYIYGNVQENPSTSIDVVKLCKRRISTENGSILNITNDGGYDFDAVRFADASRITFGDGTLFCETVAIV